MDIPAGTTLRIGSWNVFPATGSLARDGTTVQIDARSMKLLVYLAEHAGQVVSSDDLLTRIWSGVIVTQNSVYQAVTSLRRTLGDDSKKPAYIATVPRLGYRMVAPVSFDNRPPQADVASRGRPRYRKALWAAGAALCLVVALALHSFYVSSATFHATSATPAGSVGVLPFKDLTSQDMNEEYFADGMTEELVDKLSKIPDLQVRPLAKGETAESVGVAYTLHGSIRKSDSTLRIDARLVRTADGFVVWSESYDRPAADRLMMQDDIASEVVKALRGAVIRPGASVLPSQIHHN